MKSRLLVGLILNISLAALFVPATRAAEADGSCMKSGSQVQVSGASSADRKADCEQKGGSWSDSTSSAGANQRQSAGGGGGW